MTNPCLKRTLRSLWHLATTSTQVVAYDEVLASLLAINYKLSKKVYCAGKILQVKKLPEVLH